MNMVSDVLVERFAASSRRMLPICYSVDELLDEKECLGCSATGPAALAVKHTDGCEVAEVEATLDQYVQETGVHA